jgi:hypothetical protein
VGVLEMKPEDYTATGIEVQVTRGTPAASRAG